MPSPAQENRKRKLTNGGNPFRQPENQKAWGLGFLLEIGRKSPKLAWTLLLVLVWLGCLLLLFHSFSADLDRLELSFCVRSLLQLSG